MDDILRIVAEYHGIDGAIILSRCRARRYAIARHEFFWLAYWAGWTEPEIGRYAGRDPSSVNQAKTKLLYEIEYQPRLAGDIRELQTRVLNHFGRPADLSRREDIRYAM